MKPRYIRTERGGAVTTRPRPVGGTITGRLPPTRRRKTKPPGIGDLVQDYDGEVGLVFAEVNKYLKVACTTSTGHYNGVSRFWTGGRSVKVLRRRAKHVIRGGVSHGYDFFALCSRKRNVPAIYVAGCRVWGTFHDAVKHYTRPGYHRGLDVAISALIVLAELRSAVVKAGYQP